ncbi:hypothetical protein [Georgenia sp. Z1491]|uniref:hypothetical protein n=1 Tax=Georgenia sp. Z1491 TaxID=3416707 RepID=UPI003CF95BA7
MDLQGYVLAAAVIMLLVYALPAVADRRRLMAATRLEDRHSDRLRVLATVGDGGRRGRASPGHPGRLARSATDRPTAPPLLPIGPESRAMSTIKPRLSEPARRARDLAHARSQRAARMSRRDAARNRRTMYQVVLGLLTVAAWALVHYAGWNLAAAIVPSVLLAGVVALSVRAAGERRTLNSIDRAEIRRIDGELKELARRPREVGLLEQAAAEPASGDRPGELTAAPLEDEDVAGVPGSVTGGAAAHAVGAPARAGQAPAPARLDDVASRTWATVAAARLTADSDEHTGSADRAEDGPAGADARDDADEPTEAPEGDQHPARPFLANEAPDAWTPVPVPASRWADDGAGLQRRTAPSFSPPAAPSARVPLRPTRPASSGSVVAGSGADAPPVGTPRAPVLDLDAALARRRAKGA